MRIKVQLKAEELKKRLNIRDGKDALPADEMRIASDVLSRLPKPIPPTPPMEGEVIVQKLNNLPIEKEYQIGAEHIRGLEEEIKKLKTIVSEARPIFGPGKTKVLIKDLSGSLDGVTKTFTIGTHFGITGVWGSSQPMAFRPTIDYTESGRNIVFAAGIDAGVSLATGQTLIVQYLK